MPYYEYHDKWTWVETATTGASTQISAVGGKVQQFTFGFQTGAGCTCTVQMQAAPSTSGPWVGLLTTANLSTSGYAVHQLAGPLAYLRPYVTAKTTGTLVIEAFGN